jgi:hypothetical protein
VNVYTTGYQRAAAVASDPTGQFIVVWVSWVDGIQTDVSARLYNTTGTPGSEFRVNSYTTGWQSYPSVAADTNGNFVVVWIGSMQDARLDDVFGQRYDASGVPLGGEFLVNTYTPGFQRRPSVAMHANGFVVVWHGEQGGSLSDVFGQRYDAFGVRQGGEFRVNSYTPGYQSVAKAAVGAKGDLVVVWNSAGGQDGSAYGVFGQRYDAFGTPRGGEFQVNSYTTGYQNWPSLASHPDGNFVVAWQSDGQDGGNFSAFAQRFDATGAAIGGEFRVSSYETALQGFTSVAADASGRFVVTWLSYGQDGSSWGVFGQRFELDRIFEDGFE